VLLLLQSWSTVKSCIRGLRDESNPGAA